MFLILYYDPNFNYYFILKRSPLCIVLLGDFLRQDVSNDALGFIEWFKDPSNDAGSGNATDYSIDEGIMTIIPEWRPDYDECIRQGDYFALKFELVLEILRQWAPVYKARPPYITITIIDDVVAVKGSDTCPEDLDIPTERM